MKKLRLLILLGMFICSQSNTYSQVFGHPGATWVLHVNQYFQQCFEVYEKWEYTGDAYIGGDTLKQVLVSRKSRLIPAFPDFVDYSYTKYFMIEGDKVYWSNNTFDWLEIMDFELETGDTTYSPLLKNIQDSPGSCYDSLDMLLYYFPATVTNHGIDTIESIPLKYYTVKYRTSHGFGDDFSDTIYASTTYYERIGTLTSWYEFDPYTCGATDACAYPSLLCYQDEEITTDSLCDDVSWFETVSIPEQSEELKFNIYPNPVSDILMIQNSSMDQTIYDILSVDGKLVLNVVQSPVNVSNLPTGIYFITDNNRTVYQKFIKN